MRDRSLQDLGRIAAAIVVAVALGFVLVVTGSGAGDDPEPSAVLGPVGGDVVATSPAAPATPGSATPSSPSPVARASETPEPAQEATPAPTPPPTPAPTPVPTPPPPPAPAADGFSAQVFTCGSVSGSSCLNPISEMPASGSFSALVLLDNTRPGDVIEATLIGGGRTVRGGPVTVGGGDGHYFTTFGVNGFAPGTYTVVATRNGQEVDSTTIVLR